MARRAALRPRRHPAAGRPAIGRVGDHCGEAAGAELWRQITHIRPDDANPLRQAVERHALHRPPGQRLLQFETDKLAALAASCQEQRQNAASGAEVGDPRVGGDGREGAEQEGVDGVAVAGGGLQDLERGGHRNSTAFFMAKLTTKPVPVATTLASV